MTNNAAHSTGKVLVRVLFLLVILVTILMIVGIWTVVEPGYIITGYIRIAVAVQDIVTGEPDNEIAGDYEQFVRTQTMFINNNPELFQGVSIELADRDLSYFKEGEVSGVISQFLAKIGIREQGLSIYERLKRASQAGDISAAPVPGTEFMAVSMKSTRPDDAKVIVDSIVRNYMVHTASGTHQAVNDTLMALEEKKKQLLDNLQQNKRLIRSLAEEYGTTQLDSHQLMMAERQASILTLISQLESTHIKLETQIQILESGVDPNAEDNVNYEDFNTYLNKDLLVQELSRRIVDVQVDIITAKQENAPGNPAIEEKEALLDALEKSVKERREVLKQEYDQLVTEREERLRKQKLVASKAELEQLRAYEARLREEVIDQDAQTVKVGNTNLDLKDTQFQIDLDTEDYEAVVRRIRQIEMEKERKPRITLESKAEIQSFKDVRLKSTVIVLLGSCGILLVFFTVRGLLRWRRPVKV
jgi:hypothetical protein